MLRAGVPFTGVPATHYEYSNFGYALLGRIITNVSGKPYADTITRTLLQPLGMRSSGFDVQAAPSEQRALGYRWEDDAWRIEPTLGPGAFGAMGGLQTSATDYAKWVAYLLSAWPARNGADAGPVRRVDRARTGAGVEFPARARAKGRDDDAPACRQPIAYGMGMIVGMDWRSWRHDQSRWRLSGIRIARVAAARPRCRPLRVYESDLFRSCGSLYGRRRSSSTRRDCWARSASCRSAQTLPTRIARWVRCTRRVTLTRARGQLAMNFLLDRDADAWSRELKKLKAGGRRLRHERACRADRSALRRFHVALQSWPARGIIASRANATARHPGAAVLADQALTRASNPGSRLAPQMTIATVLPA